MVSKWGISKTTIIHLLMFPLVAEAVPVQNQAASQKLLFKTSQRGCRPFNSRNHRGKGRMEDQEVYTLEEYERRKSGTSQLPKETSSYTNQDEELARQLQNKFDLEDFHVSFNLFSDAYASDAIIFIKCLISVQ